MKENKSGKITSEIARNWTDEFGIEALRLNAACAEWQQKSDCKTEKSYG